MTIRSYSSNENGTQNPNNIFTLSLCQKFDQFDRLKSRDLSLKNDSQNGIHKWDICASINTKDDASIPAYEPVKYCPFYATVEQQFQYQFFQENNRSRVRKSPKCALLPPKHYRWPQKQIKVPSTVGKPSVYWSNLGVNSFEELIKFNPKFPKNIAHFDTPNYDIIHEKLIDIAAQYIPFAEKIRTMLDIGAGAGSVSFIVNKRYDVTVLNTALPDFPYCEYISERGGLCILLDSRYVLPFAKFSFDVVHHNWVFHSLTPKEWRDVLLEQNRILRPGGYLWIMDGLSFAQLRTIKFLLVRQLGYTILFERKVTQRSVIVKFASNPYEVNWHAVLMKPNRLIKEPHQC